MGMVSVQHVKTTPAAINSVGGHIFRLTTPGGQHPTPTPGNFQPGKKMAKFILIQQANQPKVEDIDAG